MKKTLLSLLFVFLAIPVAATAQTVVDRLKELDRLHKSGALSDDAYNAEWKRVLSEGLNDTPGSKGSSAMAPAYGNNPLARPWEISFSGSWTRFEAGDDEVNSASANLSLGRFVMPLLLVYGTIDYTYADVGGNDLEAYGFGAGVDFCFGSGAAGFAPYIGAGASWAEVDSDDIGDDSDWSWDVHAGIRQYVGDRVVIKYQAGYEKYDKLDLDGFTATIGIGLRF